MTAATVFLPLTPDELAVIEAHARLVAGTIPGNVDAVEKLRLIATLRRAEEEASEDATARAAYAATREEESVPVEVVDRLLAGENPVRVWREFRGLTVSALAERAGVAKGYLSEIETGKKTGSLNTLRAVATVLDVDIDDLCD